MQIAKEAYKLTSRLPATEQFGLVSQMRRAAVSLPSNIAEGFRRRNENEFRQFLHVALGSAAELETQVQLCKELHGFDTTEIKKFLELLDHFQAMTMSLIKKLGVNT